MPRGRKSKRQASEKRRQARLETPGHAPAQDTKAAAEASAEAGVAAATKASAEAGVAAATKASAEAGVTAATKASTEAGVAAAAKASAEALLAAAAEASAEALLAVAAEASAEALLKVAAEASTKAVLSVVAKASAKAAVGADKAATATKEKAAVAAASVAPVVVKKREATKERKAEDVGKKISTPQSMHGTKYQLDAASAANFKKPQEERHVATSSKSQNKKKACFFAFPLYTNPDTLARKAGVLEQFLMYKFKTKQVILKKDMLDIIGAEYEEHFDEILKKASVRIEMVFAVKVMEVDPVIHSYDLVSKIKLPNNGRLRAGQGLPKTGLLMNVLGIIFLKGNRVKEEDLWKCLGMMKVFAGRKHSIFGEPRKLITKDLVKLNYLEYRQIPNSDPPKFEFLWGPKAYAETSKRQVLEFLAKINRTEPSVFLAQFEEILKEEEK